jgi:large subunit ribosomal protein L28
MSRCELSGKGPVVKCLVSHSNMKTKIRAQPNVQAKRLFSRSLNQMIRLHVATSAIRNMERAGGFDSYILGQPVKDLSPKARTVQLRIQKKMKPAKKATTSKPASVTK